MTEALYWDGHFLRKPPHGVAVGNIYFFSPTATYWFRVYGPTTLVRTIYARHNTGCVDLAQAKLAAQVAYLLTR